MRVWRLGQSGHGGAQERSRGRRPALIASPQQAGRCGRSGTRGRSGRGERRQEWAARRGEERRPGRRERWAGRHARAVGGVARESGTGVTDERNWPWAVGKSGGARHAPALHHRCRHRASRPLPRARQAEQRWVEGGGWRASTTERGGLVGEGEQPGAALAQTAPPSTCRPLPRSLAATAPLPIFNFTLVLFRQNL